MKPHLHNNLTFEMKKELEKYCNDNKKATINVDLQRKSIIITRAKSKDDTKKYLIDFLNDLEGLKFPKTWTRLVETVNKGFVTYTLSDKNSEAYKHVKKEFDKKMSGHTIKEVTFI